MGFSWILCLHLFCLFLCGPSMYNRYSIRPQVLFRRNWWFDGYSGIDLVCLWEEVSPGSFYATILDLVWAILKINEDVRN